MDFLPFPIAYLLAGAFVTLLCFVLLLNVFGLPANWIVLGLVALWKMVHPGAANLDVWFWVMMVGLALIGEALVHRALSRVWSGPLPEPFCWRRSFSAWAR